MLPTLSIPEFTTTLPSTGKKIKFRPFLVREEKILLIALEDGEKQAIVDAVLNLLKNCIKSKIDVYKLPTFDVEWLFMQIRAKSVGEQIEMVLGHGANSECSVKTKYILNIDDLSIDGNVSDGKIGLGSGIGIKLKYPSYSEEKNIERSVESLFATVKGNVEYIYDSDQIYDDFTDKELEEWLDHLNKEQFEKVMSFFTEGPSLSHMIEWECEGCKQKEFALVEGLKDFFMLA